MSFWAYVLRCADGRYYTGHTDNLEYRIAQHEAGGYCNFTSGRRPVSLFWSQEFSTHVEALEAERRIKPWSRAKKEALAREDWAALSYYARPPSKRPSTGLGTSGEEGDHPIAEDRSSPPTPFVPSIVEGPFPQDPNEYFPQLPNPPHPASTTSNSRASPRMS